MGVQREGGVHRTNLGRVPTLFGAERHVIVMRLETFAAFRAIDKRRATTNVSASIQQDCQNVIGHNTPCRDAGGRFDSKHQSCPFFFIYLPKSKPEAPVYGECQAVNGRALLMCSKCKSEYYCCEDHQKNAWKTHKKVCTELAKLPKYKIFLSSFPL